MKFKKGFTITEILCSFLLISMLIFFISFYLNSYKNKIKLASDEKDCINEIQIVLDEITQKLLKKSLKGKYYYCNNDKTWSFYSEIGEEYVKYEKEENRLYCMKEIKLRYINDIELVDENYLKLIIYSEYYTLSFILGGLEEFEKTN